MMRFRPCHQQRDGKHHNPAKGDGTIHIAATMVRSGGYSRHKEKGYWSCRKLEGGGHGCFLASRVFTLPLGREGESIDARVAAKGFLLGKDALVGHRAEFRAAGAPAFLAADFFDFLLTGGFAAETDVIEAVAQFSPCEMAVEFAGALALAFDLDAGGQMFQIYARRGLVDFLAAGTGAKNEFLHKILLADAECGHPFVEGGLFFGR